MTIQDVDFSGWQFVSHPIDHKPRLRSPGCSPRHQKSRLTLARGGAVLAILISGLAASPVDARPDLPRNVRWNPQKTGLHLVDPTDRRRARGRVRHSPTADREFSHPKPAVIRPTLSISIASGDAPTPQKLSSERVPSRADQVDSESTDVSEIPDATKPSSVPPCTQSAHTATCPSQAATEQPSPVPRAPSPREIFTPRRMILLGVLAVGFGLLAFVRR